MSFNKINKNRTGERGNVLFLILIAVALFAALSYAVTQSTRSGGGDAGRETNRISSAQLTQYPAGVRTSIVRMIISGADVDTLEFNPPNDYASCTLFGGEATSCVFHPQGGGATHVQAPASLMAGGAGAGSWIFNGANEIENVGTSDIPASAAATAPTADLIAFLPGISKGVCESINDELGLPDPDLGAMEAAGLIFTSASNMEVGSATFPAVTSMLADGSSIGFAPAVLDGQPFGCFTHTDVDGAGTDGYVYYHVLIER